jgi:tRNA 2-thiouridine synthesizing protein A
MKSALGRYSSGKDSYRFCSNRAMNGSAGTVGRKAGQPYAQELLKIKTSKDTRMHIDKELDTRGLNCPLPILKAKKALAEMNSGQLLRVVSTDSGSTRDFMAFAKQTGNELVEQQTEGADFIHVLKRR